MCSWILTQESLPHLSGSADTGVSCPSGKTGLRIQGDLISLARTINARTAMVSLLQAIPRKLVVVVVV